MWNIKSIPFPYCEIIIKLLNVKVLFIGKSTALYLLITMTDILTVDLLQQCMHSISVNSADFT